MLREALLAFIVLLLIFTALLMFPLPQPGCMIGTCMDGQNSVSYVRSLDAYAEMVRQYGEPECAYSGDRQDGKVTCSYPGKSFIYGLSVQGDIKMVSGRINCSGTIIAADCGFGNAAYFINNCFYKTIKEKSC